MFAVIAGSLVGVIGALLVAHGGRTAEWTTGFATIALTLVTTLLAIATYGLFERTAEMAKATNDALELSRQESDRENERHQQSLSGILAVNNMRLTNGNPEGDSDGQAWSPQSGPWKQDVYILGDVRNVGFGPALGAKISVYVSNIPFSSGALSHQWSVEIGTWNAGDSHHVGPEASDLQTVEYLRKLSRPLNEADYANAKILVEWRTLFGQLQKTEYLVNETGTKIKLIS